MGCCNQTIQNPFLTPQERCALLTPAYEFTVECDKILARYTGTGDPDHVLWELYTWAGACPGPGCVHTVVETVRDTFYPVFHCVPEGNYSILLTVNIVNRIDINAGCGSCNSQYIETEVCRKHYDYCNNLLVCELPSVWADGRCGYQITATCNDTKVCTPLDNNLLPPQNPLDTNSPLHIPLTQIFTSTTYYPNSTDAILPSLVAQNTITNTLVPPPLRTVTLTKIIDFEDLAIEQPLLDALACTQVQAIANVDSCLYYSIIRKEVNVCTSNTTLPTYVQIIARSVDVTPGGHASQAAALSAAYTLWVTNYTAAVAAQAGNCLPAPPVPCTECADFECGEYPILGATTGPDPTNNPIDSNDPRWFPEVLATSNFTVVGNAGVDPPFTAQCSGPFIIGQTYPNYIITRQNPACIPQTVTVTPNPGETPAETLARACAAAELASAALLDADSCLYGVTMMRETNICGPDYFPFTEVVCATAPLTTGGIQSSIDNAYALWENHYDLEFSAHNIDPDPLCVYRYRFDYIQIVDTCSVIDYWNQLTVTVTDVRDLFTRTYGPGQTGGAYSIFDAMFFRVNTPYIITIDATNCVSPVNPVFTYTGTMTATMNVVPAGPNSYSFIVEDLLGEFSPSPDFSVELTFANECSGCCKSSDCLPRNRWNTFFKYGPGMFGKPTYCDQNILPYAGQTIYYVENALASHTTYNPFSPVYGCIMSTGLSLSENAFSLSAPTVPWTHLPAVGALGFPAGYIDATTFTPDAVPFVGNGTYNSYALGQIEFQGEFNGNTSAPPNTIVLAPRCGLTSFVRFKVESVTQDGALVLLSPSIGVASVGPTITSADIGFYIDIFIPSGGFGSFGAPFGEGSGLMGLYNYTTGGATIPPASRFLGSISEVSYYCSNT